MNQSQVIQVSCVIPAYNEEQRLGGTLKVLAEKIQNQDLHPVLVEEVLVIDDGSSDQTTAVAEEFGKHLPGFRVISLEKNSGKGFAVRKGMAAASSPWVLMADADMATPWEEAAKLGRLALEQQAKIVMGSRALKDSDLMVRQSFIREYLGRSFNVFVRLLTGLPFKDTQCGFKIIHLESVQPILNRLTIDHFAMEIELLMHAAKIKVKALETPIRWEHKEGSKIDPLKDGLRMAWHVMQIRWRLLFHL